MNEMDNAMLAIADMNDQIISVVVGYKAKLIAAGFAEQTAEEMTVVYHDVLARAVLAQASGK